MRMGEMLPVDLLSQGTSRIKVYFVSSENSSLIIQTHVAGNLLLYMSDGENSQNTFKGFKDYCIFFVNFTAIAWNTKIMASAIRCGR